MEREENEHLLMAAIQNQFDSSEGSNNTSDTNTTSDTNNTTSSSSGGDRLEDLGVALLLSLKDADPNAGQCATLLLSDDMWPTPRASGTL